jgi:hypothetical protein
MGAVLDSLFKQGTGLLKAALAKFLTCSVLFWLLAVPFALNAGRSSGSPVTNYAG